MRFIDSWRFSPVIQPDPLTGRRDVPHARDLYWVDPEAIPKKKDDYRRFLARYSSDTAWWNRQRTRCYHGFTVEHAVEFDGGELFIDGVNMIVQPDGSRYIPDLDYTVNANGDIWISGRMYFYLNFWKISIEDKFGNPKGYDHPWFTDLSWENWMTRELARKKGKDMGIFKCRQRGASEEEACDTGWIVLFVNNVQCAIVGDPEFYNKNTYNMVRRGIWNMYNTEFWKKIKYDNDDVFSTENTHVEVHNRTADGNEQCLSGLNRLYKVHIEEVGTMRKGLATGIASFVKPSIRGRAGNRTGFIVYTGTSGKYEGGVEDIEDMLYNPDAHELLSVRNIYDPGAQDTRIAYYIPAWKFSIIDENGNSLKEESLEYIKSMRASLEGKKKQIYVASEPIYTKEMFDITMGGYFGEFIIHHCNEAKNLILSHRKLQKIERGFLHPLNPTNLWEGVEWENDEEHGDILIAEHPILNEETKDVIEGLYLGGTDSYDQDTSETSESKLASGIHKGFNNTVAFEEGNQIYNNFVAMYLDRPSEAQGGREVAYDNVAKLSIYYRAPNMIEYSKTAIFDYLINIGCEGLLCPRPDFVIANIVDKPTTVNRYGFPGQYVPMGLTKLRDWLNTNDGRRNTYANIYNCPFIDIIAAWGKYMRKKGFNCDITIFTMLCIIQMDEIMMRNDYSKKNHEKQQHDPAFCGYVERNGIIVENYR